MTFLYGGEKEDVSNSLDPRPRWLLIVAQLMVIMC